MSKKYNNYNNTNNSLNINIEELKGSKVTINNDKNKYLILFPGDINFITQVEDLLTFVKTEFEKLQEEEIENNLTEEEQVKVFNERLGKIKSILNTVKAKFNSAFNDDNAYERIFGTVADIQLIITVITRVYEYAVSLREKENRVTENYTAKYRK